MADNNLNVSGLNFDQIKTNLRNFIASKPEFLDYDFADSALNTLLDLLAYNTYYNAFYANMAVNEGFIDTAQFYDNVISRAKGLGYTPISARGATANVKLIFAASIANTTFRSIVVPKDTEFNTLVDGTSYKFVTPQTYTFTANSTNGFADYIDIIEGIPLSHRYNYNRTSNTQFVLPNQNVDTRGIVVSVTLNGNTEIYQRADSVLTINSSSKIYYVDADRDQKYKIYFGDGILGKQPVTDSTVTISYRACNGEATNGANSYSITNSTIAGQTGIVVVPIGRADGGAEIEDIESVRFNATSSYQIQNRSVTADDYKRLILRENPDVSSLNVWGGEENEIPIYGKVFASVKPKVGKYFSYNRKQKIIESIKKYNVRTIDVELIDPTYLNIVPDITVRYNPTNTTRRPGDLAAAIAERVISFERDYLSNFAKPFRFSRFLDYLDSTDESISGSSAVIRLKKTFVPNLSGSNSYTINFGNTIQRLGDAELIIGIARPPGFGSVTSSSFIYQGNKSFFDDDGFGTLRIYYPSAAGRLQRVYSNYTAGTIDYTNGIVNVSNFALTEFSGDAISMFATPIFPDVTPIRNQILLMSQSEVNVVDDTTGKTVAVSRNVETFGQTATLITPSVRLYSI
jgi:hypothetical protein